MISELCDEDEAHNSISSWGTNMFLDGISGLKITAGMAQWLSAYEPEDHGSVPSQGTCLGMG